jgi:hypothetical protein
MALRRPEVVPEERPGILGASPWMSARTKLVLAAIAVVISILGVAVVWFWWIPSLIVSKAEAAARERGFEVEIDDAALRLTGVTLEHVELERGGVHAEIESLHIPGSWLSLASEGAAAVKTLEVEGGRATVGPSPGAASEGTDERASLERFERIEIQDFTIDLRDADGLVAIVHAEDVELARDSIRAELDEIRLDPEGERSAEFRDVTVHATRGERLALEKLEVAGGSINWRPGDGAETPATAVESLRRAVRAAEAIAGGRAGGSGETVDGPAEGGIPAVLDRLTSDASIRVAGLRITRADNPEAAPVANDLEIALVRRGPDEFAFSGSGTGETGGELRWQLRISPIALEVQGSVSFEGVPLALIGPFLPALPWHAPEETRLDGALELEPSGPERVQFRGSLAVRDLALFAERVAPSPVGGISFRISGDGEWVPGERRLVLREAELSMGEATATFDGTLVWQPDHYAIQAAATLPPTQCNRALHAIPPSLLDDLDRFSMSGVISARARVSIDSHRINASELEIDVEDECEFATVPEIADLRRVMGPFVHRVLEPDGTWFEMTTGPGTPNWTSIYAMSPFFVHSVVAHEDGGFFSHHGFALWAIRDALVRNLREGRYATGASTITMQLAKNLFLHREKTLVRKIQEVILTWWLEKALEKRDILELYLNVIEYGPSIYGIRQASWHYFGRDPSELTPAQSAFFATILPAPKRYYGQFDRGTISDSVATRMRNLLRRMNERGRIDADALAHGLAEVDHFRFRGEGEGRSTPGPGVGNAAPLPLGSSETSEWEREQEAEWDRWDEEWMAGGE